MYDAELGRWLGVDPKSETYYGYSPYAFCMNNPLVYTDPNGMEVIRDKKGNISITGDDIYRFWGNILSVADGKTPFDNFMDALNMAADSEDRHFLNLGETTDIIGSNSLRFLRGEKQDFSGFWGNVKYVMSGGHIGGVHYNHDGYATGMSPLMGIAPSSGMKGGGINQLNKLIKTGKVPKSILRFDKGKIFNELDHVHFNNGTALNIDGTWKHGMKMLSKTEIKFLIENGWKLPKK